MAALDPLMCGQAVYMLPQQLWKLPMHVCIARSGVLKAHYLLQVLIAQLDGEQQLPGPVEVTENPAGQDVGFV